jgi:hypothetical protein
MPTAKVPVRHCCACACRHTIRYSLCIGNDRKDVPRVTTRASFEYHTFLGLFLGSAESRKLSWEETHLPGQGRGEREESKVDARGVGRRQCE